MVDHLRVSERRACRVLRQSRAAQRYFPLERTDEGSLTRQIVELASMYGRYGTPRITTLLREEGWQVPKKQSNRGRLWLNDGSCLRLRPEHQDHA